MEDCEALDLLIGQKIHDAVRWAHRGGSLVVQYTPQHCNSVNDVKSLSTSLKAKWGKYGFELKVYMAGRPGEPKHHLRVTIETIYLPAGRGD